MPNLNVWMPGRSWLQQNGGPAGAFEEMPQAFATLGPAMYMYSPLTLQAWASAYSRPPPIVGTALVLPSSPVLISAVPPPVLLLSTMLVWTFTNAAPPFT